MSRVNFGIILILGLMSTVAHSMRFDLQSGATKCISDDIKSSAMTVGKYAVVNPNEGSPVPDSHKLTVRVTSPHGSNYHYGDHVESGNFAFTAAETGDYSACFWVSDHKPSTTVTIDFDWKTGVAAKDWSNVAKKGQIEVSNLLLAQCTYLHFDICFWCLFPFCEFCHKRKLCSSILQNFIRKCDASEPKN
ncbi:hypothetical protein FF2_044569 [Malus domestica]